VFIVLFSLTDDESFTSVKCKWNKEIMPTVLERGSAILLVGTKADLVTDAKTLEEKSNAARSLSLEIGASGYLETSSKEMRGVKEVIEAACTLRKDRKGRGPQVQSNRCISS
jgi:GTPase SAR1 family protein